jgi:putative tricarboxylic transport membrane protein
VSLPPAAGRGLLGLRLAALSVVVLGAVGLWGAGQIRQPGGYSPVGPRVFPYVVSIGLLGFGLLFLARTTIWPDHELVGKARGEAAGTHWPTPLLLGGWLIVYAFLLSWAGYVIATALFVPVNARILGSTKPRRDAVVGALLAVILYLAFTRFLGVRLPAGLLDIG